MRARTPLICSLVTGFACENSTTIDELAEVASHILNEDIEHHMLIHAGTGIRNRCMGVLFVKYPNLPTEKDITTYGIDDCVARTIGLYGSSLEI